MPKDVDHEQRRTHVISATCRLLAREGLSGLTMRAIAAEAGCTTGLITHYFASKADLVSAAMSGVAAAQARRAREHVDHGRPDPVNALAELLPLDRARAEETRVWLAFYAEAVGSPAVLRLHQQHYAEWRQILADALGDYGALDDDRRELIVGRLVIDLNGLAIQGVLDAPYWTPRRQRAQLEHIVTEAVAASASRA